MKAFQLMIAANPFSIVGQTVKARVKIEECPLANVPAVPAGRKGIVMDYDTAAKLFLVDFGNGAILCSANDLA